MPNDKVDNDTVDQDAIETKKRVEALALAIREEMGSLTQEELEKLYAAVVLMGLDDSE